MIYSTFGKTGCKVSKMGMGTQRLPLSNEGGKVSYAEAIDIITRAYELGVNYFDTAEAYLNHHGELLIGQAVKPFREKVHIATKISTAHLQRGVKEHIESCFERLGVDYIDFFLLHSVTESFWEHFDQANTLSVLEQFQKEGRIRHIGFSYHGGHEFFIQLLSMYNWAFVQVQYNYIDQEIQAQSTGTQIAHSMGMGTTVMCPLKGGILVDKLTPTMTEAFRALNPERTLAEWGYRWLYDKQYVDVVLNGVNSLATLEENVASVNKSDVPITDQERQAYDLVRKRFMDSSFIQCTSCNYCIDCPEKIDIPRIIEIYNNYLYRDDKVHYNAYYVFKTKGKNKCINCGRCERKCPQNIKIPSLLNSIHTEMMSNTKRSMLK